MAQGSAAEITLFGATGYTGQKIARALIDQGLDFRIAGRSAKGLAELSQQLANRPAWLVADAAQPASLPALFQHTRLLINCAGPYTDLGERVIAQAALSGVHYLDLTNELGYLYKVRSYHQMALQSGAALVPACGFEVALADCLASLAGAALSPIEDAPLERVDIVYALSGPSSRGTRRSAVRSLATSWLAYRDGQWTGQMPGGRVRKFNIKGKTIHALAFPSCESITVPSHQPVRNIDVWMSVPASARVWAPVGIPLLARLSRSILRGLILRIAARSGVGPASGDAADDDPDAPISVFARAERGGQEHWLALEGNGPYPITAAIIAFYARAMTQPGYARRGLLAPSQALEPREVVEAAVNDWGCTLRGGPDDYRPMEG